MARFDSGITYDSGLFFDAEDAPPASEPPAYTIGTMRNLARFLANPFDDPGISLAELTSFTTDHIERMIANNPGGVLAARISATTAALGVLETAFTQDLLKLGNRKARKTAKDLLRGSLPAATSRIEGALKGAYGEGAIQVQQAFPQGRNVFNICPDDALDNHLDVMNTIVASCEEDLPAAVVSISASLVADWGAIYAQSESATGDKTATEAEKRAARLSLQLELYRNLVKLMELYPRQPDQLPLYMQQHLLENDSPADEDDDEEEDPTPDPEPEE